MNTTEHKMPRKTLRAATVAKINARLDAENSPISIREIHGDFFLGFVCPSSGKYVFAFSKLLTKDQAEKEIVERAAWLKDKEGKTLNKFWCVEDVDHPRFKGQGHTRFMLDENGQITTDISKIKRYDNQNDAYNKARDMNPGNGKVNFAACYCEEWIEKLVQGD